MNNRPSTHHHASSSIEDLIDHASNHQQNWLLSYLDVFVLIIMLILTIMALNDFKTEQPPKAHKKDSAVESKPKTQVDIVKHTPIPPAPTTVEPAAPTENLEKADNLINTIKKIDQKPVLLNNTQTPSLLTEDKTEPNNNLNPLSVPTLTSDHQPADDQLQQQLKKTVEALGLSNSVKMKVTQGYAQLEIQDKILFSSSESKLLDEGEILLKKLAPLLEQSLGLIYIEGHTDNRPIKTTKFPSNWELGAARATSVLHFLVTQQVDSSRLRAITYGDTKPIADNTTIEGRGKNRRVSIAIKVSDKIN